MSEQDDNGDLDYGDETCIRTADGIELRCPAYPAECSYVRVRDKNGEFAYWSCDEWTESPEQGVEVMGAIIGALKGGRLKKATQ